MRFNVTPAELAENQRRIMEGRRNLSPNFKRTVAEAQGKIGGMNNPPQPGVINPPAQGIDPMRYPGAFVNAPPPAQGTPWGVHPVYNADNLAASRNASLAPGAVDQAVNLMATKKLYPR